MRHLRSVLPAVLVLVALVGSPVVRCAAQTYTPKEIRIDAPPGTDTAEPLRIAALPQHAPLTKQQIEEALGRLADTGLFSEISYTVGPEALIIKLTPVAGSQSLPALYGNFVWWQPGELEPLVEARLPIYKGKLPSAGTLTTQVEAALKDLLRQKGINGATIDANLVQSGNGKLGFVDLTVTHPEILVDNLHVLNGLPALKDATAKFAESQRSQDFDIGETYQSIRLSLADMYQNAGYLDVSSTTPVYSAPHKDLNAYAVDLTVTVQPGTIYRVSGINLQPAPPLSQADLLKAADIKPGNPASPLAQRIAQGEITKAYADLGYIEAQVDLHPVIDHTAHTVAYNVTIDPGEVFHLAGVDTSALPADQQAAFARNFHPAPNAIADREITNEILKATIEGHLPRNLKLGITTNRTNRTVTYKLLPPSGTVQ